MFTKNKNLIMFLFLAISWAALMSFDETRPYGWMYFGSWFLVLGLIALCIRIDFDISAKDTVIGELIELERMTDGEGTSYRPHYKYTYNGEEKVYKSNVSSFRYIKTKQIGQEEELLILIKKPTRIRMNNKTHQVIEYFGLALFILIGTSCIVAGIFMLP